MPSEPSGYSTHSQVTLTWANKHTPSAPSPAALHLCETFEPSRSGELQQRHTLPDGGSNALYHGDNAPILAHLLAKGWEGRFHLIYADPPYNSGMTWTRKVRRRGPEVSSAEALVGQQPQYGDAWDESAYLQFLYERLPLLRRLLADDGTFWLHCDHRHTHHLRCLLEEVFGPKNYLNTITWRSQTTRGAKVNAFYFANSAHAIHVFAKQRSAATRWTPARKLLVLSAAQAAREFMRDERGFFRTSDPGTFSFESLQRLHAEGRLYAPYGGEVVLDAAARRAHCSNGGNIGVKYHLADLGDGRYAVERGVDNIWDDIPGLGTTPSEDLGYPTQKTEALLHRIVATATQPGDWVLDPFMGSGTTPAMAQKLGRRWVGCDVGLGGVQTSRRRLQAVIQEQVQTADEGKTQNGLGSGAQSNTRAFCVYAQSLPTTDAPLQIDLAITPIGGDAARIRVTVARVTWRSDAQRGEGVPPGEGRHEYGWRNEDWRSAVDAIAIDPQYDGSVLRVALADAPLKRSQLVAGDYVLPLPPPSARIAVRVTDIWGQEALAVQTIEGN